MKISIFGMGYVGAVSAACLADDGHDVVGVDPVQTKVDLINAGKTPIIEKDIGEMIQSGVKAGRLRATTDSAEAVAETELSLICVGTPSQINGSLDLKFVRRVCEDIGRALAGKNDYHVVVVRSTMLPGSVETVVLPTLEESSGKSAGKDFGLCINPEFLREGTAVYDFRNPPKTVIGEIDARSGDVLATIYEGLDAPLIRTEINVAEMVKYTDNVWHALKVTFANEIGNIAKALDIDSHKVMDIFVQDMKLNISPSYLKPGFAFGGSCLPKDLRALTYKAKSLDVDVPVLSSVLPSNTAQIERGLQRIIGKGNKKIGILGFSFKAGTDDLRESPMVEIIERLIGKGYDLKLYDRNVNIASLMGANKDYILNRIPHISKLMVVNMDAVLEHGETLAIGNNDPEFKDIFHKLDKEQVVVDLVRITEDFDLPCRYDGISW